MLTLPSRLVSVVDVSIIRMAGHQPRGLAEIEAVLGVEVDNTAAAAGRLAAVGRQVEPSAWVLVEAQAGRLAAVGRQVAGLPAVADIAVPTVAAVGRKARGCQRLPR